MFCCCVVIGGRSVSVGVCVRFCEFDGYSCFIRDTQKSEKMKKCVAKWQAMYGTIPYVHNMYVCMYHTSRGSTTITRN